MGLQRVRRDWATFTFNIEKAIMDFFILILGQIWQLLRKVKQGGVAGVDITFKYSGSEEASVRWFLSRNLRREAVNQGVNWGKGIEGQSVTYKALEQRYVWDVWETLKLQQSGQRAPMVGVRSNWDRVTPHGLSETTVRPLVSTLSKMARFWPYKVSYWLLSWEWSG